MNEGVLFLKKISPTMKNLYLLLLLPAFFAAGQNQTWQVDFNANVTTLNPLPNGHWLVGGTVGGTNWLFSNGYLAETSLDGAYFSAKEIDLIDRTIISAVIPLPDGRQVVAGMADACDVGAGGFIRLQNAVGTTVWARATTWQPNFDYVPAISALALTAQQELIAVGEDKIWLLELETGLVLQEKELPGANIYDLAYTSDSLGFLLAAGNSIYSMDMGLNLTLLNTIPEPNKHYTRVAPAPDNGFFALRNDNKILYRRWFGIGFNLLTIEKNGFQVNDIVATGKGAILCGLDGNLGGVIFITDTALVETSEFPLPAPDLIPQRIRIDPATGKIIIAGVELHGPSPRNWDNTSGLSSGNQHFWIQSFETDGSSQHNGVDAALTEIIAHKLPKAEPFNDAPWTLLKWRIYSDSNFSVRLKNTGTETLQSVHVIAGRYSTDDPGFCPAQNYINKRFTQLDLAPGKDTLLLVGNLGYGYTQQVLPWKLCFWVTSPNGTTDANHDNDFVCGEFNLISAAHEPETAEVNLYPNPAQEFLYAPENPGRCRIFNAAGLLVSEQTPAADQRIDVRRLPAGFYLLQTERGRGRFVKN